MSTRAPMLVAVRLIAVLLATSALVRPAAAEMIGKCYVEGKKSALAFTPAKPGQLTVEVSLPAPGWWNGDTPESIQDGYEYCLAANIAYRLGLSKVETVDVAWDGLIAGQTKGFDLALSQISITDERRKVVDVSTSYFSADIGVLVKKGKKLDSASIKDAVIGVQEGTTGAEFAAQTLNLKIPPKMFPDTPSMFTSLKAGQIDVALTDTAIALEQAKESVGMFAVIGQYKTGEAYGALFPKGSANEATLNAVIGELIRDRTTAKLSSKYLVASFGADPTRVPYFKP